MYRLKPTQLIPDSKCLLYSSQKKTGTIIHRSKDNIYRGNLNYWYKYNGWMDGDGYGILSMQMAAISCMK